MPVINFHISDFRTPHSKISGLLGLEIFEQGENKKASIAFMYIYVWVEVGVLF